MQIKRVKVFSKTHPRCSGLVCYCPVSYPTTELY